MSKIAWVFPGQGAQKTGMGKDFYETSACAKGIYDKASALLDLDVPALCFTPNDRLDETEYTQAALVTTSLAIARVLEEKGLYPDMTAGLSLGEYCAVAIAGGISDEAAIQTVRTRGQLMQHSVAPGVGAMAAVLGISKEALLEVTNQINGVSLANENCPGQLVITGYKGAVEEACEALKQAGAKRTMPLQVSGPFHSPLQKGAGEALGKVLQNVETLPLCIPYFTNVTGEIVTDVEGTKALLETQVFAPVLWQKCVESMIAAGCDTFVEIGPGTTLTGCIRKINRDVKTFHIGTIEEMEVHIGELLCRQEK